MISRTIQLQTDLHNAKARLFRLDLDPRATARLQKKIRSLRKQLTKLQAQKSTA